MSFRDFVAELADARLLTSIDRPVDPHLQAASLLKALDGTPVRLRRPGTSGIEVLGNVFSQKALLARYFGIAPEQLIGALIAAIDHPALPTEISSAPCQEVTRDLVDLAALPLLFHCPEDGGRYITSGVVVAKDPEYGQNLDFHRMMQISNTEFAVRVVSGRHFHRFLERAGRMPMAVCIGNGAEVLLAAATSVALGQDELEIAAALAQARSPLRADGARSPLCVTRARTFDALIPADAELVLEGYIERDRRVAEGPFVDLTETYDIVRKEPVFTVTHISHRLKAMHHALLPGGLEHKLLMGMPREPTIFRAVRDAGIECLDVNINPGGCSWLHAIVKIREHAPGDGRRALEAAFRGHSSLKHAFVVGEDIDIYDPESVEWAMATRFQGDRALLIRGREPGSSLDPSADASNKSTYKMGFDLTAPAQGLGKHFGRASYAPIDLEALLPLRAADGDRSC